MRFQIILAVGFIALASASPLVDKKQSQLRVVDIPADLFAEAAENVEVQKPEEVEADTAAAAAPVVPEEKVSPTEVVKEEKKEEEVDSTLDLSDKKNDANETEEIDRPAIFGFRLPTIVILRRPAVFDDPFSFFPFGISSFNRRPAFGPPPSLAGPNNRDDEVRPTNADASPSEQRPISIGGSGSGAGISHVMHNMRQQMDSLFSSLFAPNPGFFNPNRQFFPRPFFPSIATDSSEDSKEFLDVEKFPDNYKNSTSETKVVDGQVIQVNKTVHKISGNNSNGFFQFSVIKIRPSEDTPVAEDNQKPEATVLEEKKPETAEAEVTTIKAQQESEMNNPSLNEVDQDEKLDMGNTKYETDPGLLEEPSSGAPISLPLTQEIIYDFVPLQLQSMPLIQSTNGDEGKDRPHDLSSDLRVNNLMANNENGRLRSLVDPDEIEIIEV
ncbi:unnamed protein product [Orchesella dallaii]|uniref:Icarapin-like n=1 Tax=Orchesella dallaii TaxID=48710 RepID=A0ABP1QQ97_9HEXA